MSGVIPDRGTAFGGSAAEFGQRFSVPVRIRLARVRGF